MLPETQSFDTNPRFWKAGGMRQLRIQTGQDLKLIGPLDHKLWVVLSCPTKGLEFDESTLAMIDTDGDGRIHCQELIDALEWTFKRLKNHDSLSDGKYTLPLEFIDDGSEEGARLLQSARRVLSNLGKPEATEIYLADTLDTESIFAAVKYNGDGIIPPQAADDPEVKHLIEEILATVGGETDRGGAQGVDSQKVELFFNSLENYRQWRQRGESARSSLLVLGDETEAAFASMKALESLIEEFFAKCRLVSFDQRAEKPLNSPQGDYSSLNPDSIPKINDILKESPLAKINAEGRLPLTGKLNPYYASALEKFQELAVVPLLGDKKDGITELDWGLIKSKFAPYADWLKAKAGGAVEKLGLDRIEAILASSRPHALENMMAEDRKIAAEIEAIAEVEMLLRFHRDLFRLTNNFVALPDFYHLEKNAIFQAGTLTMDGRDFYLCLDIEDVAKHAAIAGQAGIYLLYCELKGPPGTGKRLIAAAVTSGTSNRLAVGKNGLFRDRGGCDWEATVVRIAAHPIGVREAIVGPFKRLSQLVTSQIEKISTTREQAFQSQLKEGISAVDKNVTAKPVAPAPAAAGGGMGGFLAGGGLAIAALSSSFAFITSTLSNVDLGTILYTALVFLMFILLPPAILSLLKLGKRDLSLVLEACGWAINGPMRLNFSLSRILTRRGIYPGPRKKLRWSIGVMLALVLTAFALYLYKGL